MIKNRRTRKDYGRNHALEARQNRRDIQPEPQRKTLAPTYRGIVPLIIAALTDGTDKGKTAAKAELYQMADLADRYNANIKD